MLTTCARSIAEGVVCRAMANPIPRSRRVALAQLPTPLEPLDRLAAALGRPPRTLWVKRDDLTGLGGGGNKARKLDYLCAEALDQGCDTLVTGGGPQSNHVRMTAAAANRLGMGCTVVVAGDRPAALSGNLVLDELFGAEIEWFGGAGELPYAEVEAAITETARRLAVEGRRPYPMPIGGASAVGALGYVHGARELRAQAPGLDLPGFDLPGLDRPGFDLPGFDLVVVADGSGGTHAGLAAGLGDHGRVLGVDVGARDDLDALVPELAREAAALAGLPEPRPAAGGRPQVDHGQAGPGYGAPTAAAREAVLMAARLEGLILDPVYTGKAMAGLIAACREERIGPAANVVFLHTGGMPALFASSYAGWLKTD